MLVTFVPGYLKKQKKIALVYFKTSIGHCMHAIKSLHLEWHLNMIMSKFSKLLGECKFREKCLSLISRAFLSYDQQNNAGLY